MPPKIPPAQQTSYHNPKNQIIMKRKTFKSILAAALITLAGQPMMADRLVDLETGAMFEGTADTEPLRTITEDEDGITVRYEFSYASVSTPDNSPGALLWSIPGFSTGSTQGTPAVIGTTDIFNITRYGNVKVDVIESAYTDLPYELAPTPNPVFDTSLPVVAPDKIAPYSGLYPAEPVDMGERTPCATAAISMSA